MNVRQTYLVKFDKRFFFVITLIALGLPAFWLIQIALDDSLATEVSWEELLGSIAYAVGYTLIISMLTSWTWNFVQRKFPWEKGKFAQRIIIQLVLTNLVSVGAMVVLTFLNLKFLNEHCSDPEALYRGNVQITVIMNLIIVLTFEAMGFFTRWKMSLVENEKLAKANAISQYQSLKNQLNPHFLFNSLNTLSALVHSDADKAESFIDEFASVYRYVLDVTDLKHVTVQEETEFVRSFIYLHQIRFGDSLQVVCELQESDYQKWMAPLTVQILVENAIKHNVISQSHPLCVTISSDGHYLVVKNNLTPRPEEVKSTQLGQENIIQRYSFLIDEEPTFSVENNFYVARIPLIRENTDF